MTIVWTWSLRMRTLNCSDFKLKFKFNNLSQIFQLLSFVKTKTLKIKFRLIYKLFQAFVIVNQILSNFNLNFNLN